jgi:hypothetical protein
MGKRSINSENPRDLTAIQPETTRFPIEIYIPIIIVF